MTDTEVKRTHRDPDIVDQLRNPKKYGSLLPPSRMEEVAANVIERLRRENKRYGNYFLDTVAVVDAFRADDRTELGKSLRALGKSFDAITGDRDALEEAAIPKPGPPQAPHDPTRRHA